MYIYIYIYVYIFKNILDTYIYISILYYIHLKLYKEIKQGNY